MKKILLRFLSVSICFALIISLNINMVYADDIITYPKNVILLIGDGMGFNHLAAARAQKGGPLYMDAMQYSGNASTSNISGTVTDSAAAGTALATGVKTLNGRVGVDQNGANITPNLTEYFKGYGKKVGVVTTCSVTDATPAAFTAHNISRYNQTDIAIQQINNNIDIIMGGGSTYFTGTAYNNSQGNPSTLFNVATTERGYTSITTRSQLLATSSTKILALFSTSYMAYESVRTSTQPSIAEMTAKSIELLSGDPDGFFLMVEGGQIDTVSHNNDLSNAKGETIAFDNAVQVALNYQASHSDTLVIVTADHETGGLTYNSSTGQYYFTSTNHTGVNVPLFSSGVGADCFSGNLINTDIPNRLKKLVGNSGAGISFYNYKLSGTTVKGLTEQTDKNDFLNGLLLAENAMVKILDRNGMDMTAPDYSGPYQFIGTGSTIDVYIGEELQDTYKAMLRGDVNGDGYIDSGDMFAVRRYILGKDNLQNEFLTAANVDMDINGYIDSGDLLTIKRYLLGLETINQLA